MVFLSVRTKDVPLFQIETVSGPGQLKTFFKFASQKNRNGPVEDQLLKNLLMSPEAHSENLKVKMWLSYLNGEVIGRIAAFSGEGNIGYIPCFNSESDSEHAKLLLRVAVKFLMEEGVAEIRAMEFPGPSLTKGLVEADQLSREFWKMGFLPGEDLRIVKDNLSNILKKHTSSLVLATEKPIEISQWRPTNWEREIASAAKIFNAHHADQSYLSDMLLEETIMAHGSPHLMIGLTAYRDGQPLGFLVAFKTVEKIPRFETLQGIFKRSVVRKLDLVFLERLHADDKLTLMKLWKEVENNIRISNHQSEDPIVEFRSLEKDQGLHRIVFAKFIEKKIA